MFRTGHRIQGRLVRFLYREAPDECLRCGVVVPKRMGSAPRRRRGKRVCREALRRLMPWIKNGYWAIVMMRPYGLEEKAGKLYAEMGELLASAGLMKESWPRYDWDEVDSSLPSNDGSRFHQDI